MSTHVAYRRYTRVGDNRRRAADGLVQVDTEMIDRMLADIVRPDLRLSLWKAMWQLVYGDDVFADAEIVLLRVTSTWGIEADAKGNGRLAA